jgi:hypothetical protein
VHWVLRIDKHGDPRCPRNEVLEQLELFPIEAFLHERRNPGGRPAWMRQALDKAKFDWLGKPEKDQWNRRGGGVDREGRWSHSDDDLRLKGNELCRKGGDLLRVVTPIPISDLEVPAIDPAVFAQPQWPSLGLLRYFGLHKHADAVKPLLSIRSR